MVRLGEPLPRAGPLLSIIGQIVDLGFATVGFLEMGRQHGVHLSSVAPFFQLWTASTPHSRAEA